MKTSQKIGGAFVLTCAGCVLAAPELMKDGLTLANWSAPATWGAGLSFMGVFIGAVTGVMALVKKDKDPLDQRQTERAVGNALSGAGVATKADLNALAERLLAERDPGAEAPPVEQLAAALDGLARSGAAAKTEAFDLIRQDRMDEGLAQLEAFAQRQSEVLGQAAEQTAETWRQIGVLLLTRNVAKAAEAFEQAEAAAPGDRWTLVELCRLYTGSLGKPQAAAHLLPRLRNAVADQSEKILALESEGDVFHAQGHLAEALDRHEEGLAVCRALAEEHLDDAKCKRDLSVVLNRVGDVLYDLERPTEALARYQESLALRRKLAEDDPDNVRSRRDLSVSLERIGEVLRRQGHLSDALERHEESLILRRVLVQDEPGDAGRCRDLSVALLGVGDVLRDQGDFAGALSHFEEGLTLRRRLANDDPSHAERRRDVSVALERAGEVLRRQGRLVEALEHNESSLTLCRALAGDDPSHVDRRRDLSVCLNNIGGVLEAMERTDEALARYRESLPISEALVSTSPDHPVFQRDVEFTRNRIAILEATAH